MIAGSETKVTDSIFETLQKLAHELYKDFPAVKFENFIGGRGMILLIFLLRCGSNHNLCFGA